MQFNPFKISVYAVSLFYEFIVENILAQELNELLQKISQIVKKLFRPEYLYFYLDILNSKR